MSTVTAFALVGTPHPNDGDISPTYFIELWEGSVATWVLRRLEDGAVISRVTPAGPDQIGDALVHLVRQLGPVQPRVPETPWDMSLVISILTGSTLATQIEPLKSLVQCDVHILNTVYSRTFNTWTGHWTTEGHR